MIKFFLLTLLMFSALICNSQSITGCDPNYQWVEYDIPYPSIVDHGEFASVYNNELYVLAETDSTVQIMSTTYDYHQILKLDTLNNSWQTLNTFYHNCTLYDFEVHSTGIYISGSLCGLNGDPNFKSIARFNGITWETIPEISDLNPGIIHDMTDYNGNLVICGSFIDGTNNELNQIAQFDGSTWSSVGLGFNNTETGTLYSLAEFNGELFVAGSFDQALTSNTNLSIWNGSNWVTSPPATGTIYQLYSNDTCLFAYGSILLSNIGSTPVQGVAYYNSGQWYAMGGPISASASHFSVTDIDNQIYFDSPSSGVLTFENGNWKELPKVHSNFPRITAYKGNLMHLGPDYSCGAYLSGVAILCDTIECGLIEGNVYVDTALNCINDNDGVIMPPIIEINPGNQVVSLDSAGNYRRIIKAGTYDVSVVTPTWYSAFCPTGSVSTTVVAGNPNSGIDFSIEALNNIKDLQTSLAQSPARPGFPTAIHIGATNIGTEPLDAYTVVTYADSLIYDSASVAITNLGGNQLEINWGNLNVFENKNAVLYFSLPPSVTLLGQTLETTALGSLTSGTDPALYNNKDTIHTIITGAYDPNMKQVSPVGDTTNNNPGYVWVGTDEFTYTIHFQNTGSDTAFKVVLIDTIHQNLDVASFSLISSSHPLSYKFYGTNLLEFTFDNILLLDSSTNLMASQGYVKFKMNTIQGLSQGDEIKNYADIYFDFNPPIQTNTVINTQNWVLSIPITETQNLNLELYPNPLNDVSTLSIEGVDDLDGLELRMYTIQGQLVRVLDLSGKSETHIYRNGLSSGLYVVTIMHKGQQLGSKKLMIE